MARVSFLSISLAAKCRILFGLAVLLIVAAALLVPWLRMRDLVHEANAKSLRRLGRLTVAQLELLSGNWELQEQALRLWWPENLDGTGADFPLPELIPLSDVSGRTAPVHSDPFVEEAIAKLAADPTVREYAANRESTERELVYRIVFPIRGVEGKPESEGLRGVLYLEHVAPDARRELLINIGLTLMAGGLAGILAVLVFYLITQKLILSPVRELTRVAESVSQGEHSVRSEIATGDEFEELSRSFNAMLAHLQASENELMRINKSLDARLAELAEHNVALFEANKLKSQFLSNVSHELRTPLASIIGFAELLREASSTEGGRMHRFAENIMSSGRMLLGLINDLLDLAKIEAGKLELHPTTIDMRALAQNLIDFIRPLADKKSLQLVADLPEDVPTISSDPGRIQQILYNLLSNAVKFTPEGGLVELRLGKHDDEHVFVRVRDTGIGIPEADLPRVFEKFRQLDGSMTREHSGTGLGLAISKELVTLLAGRIEVASEVDKGSAFTVILPIAAPEKVEVSAYQNLNLI